jgi:hypothetical protein
MKEAELFSNARGVSISPAARMRLLAERISTIVMSAPPASARRACAIAAISSSGKSIGFVYAVALSAGYLSLLNRRAGCR